MDNTKISVTLTGPAKIDGVREPQGKTVTVTTALALQLAASGVINPVQFDEVETLSADFDAAIAAAVADREANWATALDHFETMAEDAAAVRVKGMEAQRDAAEVRVVELEAGALADVDRIATLEAALKAATAELAAPATKTGQKTPNK